MQAWSTSRKGAVAEAEIAAAAIRLELPVLRPVAEGGRYDIVIDIGERLLRVQCKWASRIGDVLNVRCATSRHTPRGYIKTTYSVDEIDVIAAYAPDTDRCYLIPIGEAAGMAALSLRLEPTRNNQATNVRWARDYEFETALRRDWGVGRRLTVMGQGRSQNLKPILWTALGL
ncbi:MAG: group I intron-associated PD-(D/E)XK endonuclease [Solirubrobacteraceae bacterium]